MSEEERKRCPQLLIFLCCLLLTLPGHLIISPPSLENDSSQLVSMEITETLRKLFLFEAAPPLQSTTLEWVSISQVLSGPAPLLITSSSDWASGHRMAGSRLE